MANYEQPKSEWRVALLPASEKEINRWLGQHQAHIIQSVDGDLICRFSAPGDGQVLVMYLMAAAVKVP